MPCDGCAKDAKLLRATLGAAIAANAPGVTAAAAASPSTPLTESSAAIGGLLAAFDAHRGSALASTARLLVFTSYSYVYQRSYMY